MEVSIPEVSFEVPVWVLAALAVSAYKALSLAVTVLWRRNTSVGEWNRGPLAVAIFLFWPVLLPTWWAFDGLGRACAKAGDCIDDLTEYLAGR